DFDELNVEPPQLGGIAPAHVGAQQVAAFAPTRLAQLFAVERVGEGGFAWVDRYVEEAPCRGRLGAGGTELHQQALAREVHSIPCAVIECAAKQSSRSRRPANWIASSLRSSQ